MRATVHSVALVALSVAFFGCGEGEEHGHGHGGGGTVAVPDHYDEAMQKCEELSRKIEGHIAKGHLEDVHPIAADIKKIAESLARLAKDDLPAQYLRDVNVKATELAGLFSAIDDAADAGKKADTIKVHNRMKALIADLKKHAAHVKEDHHG